MLSCKGSATGQTVAPDLLLDQRIKFDNSGGESEVKVKSTEHY
jgi:hypothetical protein